MPNNPTPPTPDELATWKAATDAAINEPWKWDASLGLVVISRIAVPRLLAEVARLTTELASARANCAAKHAALREIAESAEKANADEGMNPIWVADVAESALALENAGADLLAEVARLRALFAWEAGELSEQQAADLIANGDRLDARAMLLEARAMAAALNPPPPHAAESVTDEDKL